MLDSKKKLSSLDITLNYCILNYKKSENMPKGMIFE